MATLEERIESALIAGLLKHTQPGLGVVSSMRDTGDGWSQLTGMYHIPCIARDIAQAVQLELVRRKPTYE